MYPLQSSFLWWALAAAIPLVLHLISRWQSKRVELGTTRFLLEILNDQAHRKRIRRWLLLATRMAMIRNIRRENATLISPKTREKPQKTAHWLRFAPAQTSASATVEPAVKTARLRSSCEAPSRSRAANYRDSISLVTLASLQ